MGEGDRHGALTPAARPAPPSHPMGRLSPTGLHELLQRQAVSGQRALQQRLGLILREPVRFKGRRPRQFGLMRTQVAQRHIGQAVGKGRFGQQGVA